MNRRMLGLLLLGGWAAWRTYREQTRYSFRGKVVLVTGGSRGLGLVLARKLADRGAILVLCARDRQELTRAVDELEGRGAHVVGRVADLARSSDAEELVRAISDRFGRLDAVINNAGVIQVGPVETMSLDDFHVAMSNNFWSAVHVLEPAVPLMKKTGGGRIVNIASIGGKVSVPHLLPYCASKFALVGYSQGLRVELAKDGIVVTTICPGLMRTGSHGQALFKGNESAEYTWFSIGGSMPLVTLSAENAAEQILLASEYGQAEAVLSMPARILSFVNQLMPQAASFALSAVNGFLPRGHDDSAPPKKGFDSHSTWAPSVLTQLNDAAEVRNNERPATAEAAATAVRAW